MTAVNDNLPLVATAHSTDANHNELLAFLRAIHAAKLTASGMYASLAEQMPTLEGRLAVKRLSADEAEHTAALAHVAGPEASAEIPPIVSPGCGLHDESWPSALMAAFALDQAATAALLAFSSAGDASVAGAARRIVADERSHQSFAVGAFKSVADRDPAAGRRLAGEMLVARDWVKQVFPRHAILAELASAGTLPPDAAKVHDSFLASLGDRIQEALGVLGD